MSKDGHAAFEFLETQRNILCHRRQHMMALLLHYAELPQNETYQVELDRRRFLYLIDGLPAIESEAMLIGTYSQDQKNFRFALYNENKPFTDEKGVLRTLTEDEPRLAPLAKDVFWNIEEDTAWLLCDFIAAQCDYLGAYPAATEGGVVAFLALKPRHAQAPSFDPEYKWCTSCGRWPHLVEKLVSGEQGYLCNECVALVREIGREKNIPNLEASEHPELPACFMTGRKIPRVMLTYSAVSFLAAEMCADINPASSA